MRWLIALTLAFAACMPPALQVGISAQRAALIEPGPTPTPLALWAARSRTMTAAREATCPAVPHGCFARPPACASRLCFCPRVCAPNASAGPPWRGAAADCQCHEAG